MHILYILYRVPLTIFYNLRLTLMYMIFCFDFILFFSVAHARRFDAPICIYLLNFTYFFPVMQQNRILFDFLHFYLNLYFGAFATFQEFR